MERQFEVKTRASREESRRKRKKSKMIESSEKSRKKRRMSRVSWLVKSMTKLERDPMSREGGNEQNEGKVSSEGLARGQVLGLC